MERVLGVECPVSNNLSSCAHRGIEDHGRTEIRMEIPETPARTQRRDVLGRIGKECEADIFVFGACPADILRGCGP